MKKSKLKTNGGAAMLIAIIFFLFLSAVMVTAVANPILKSALVSRNLLVSKGSYYLSEGALEDAIYRVKKGYTVSSGEVLSDAGGSATISVTTTMDGKTVDSFSTIGGIVRKMESSITTGDGVSFNYGIQTGTGGFVLNGGSRVNGNIYSNGDIVATNGVVITGSAISANSSALSADQTNDTPSTPPNTVSFRNSSATQDLAQGFRVNSAGPINKVSLYIKKVGNPSDITVRVVRDSSGVPGTTNLFSSQGTLYASLVSSSSFGWVDVVFPENPDLSSGNLYWIVLDNGTQSSSNYYVVGANSSYSSGVIKLGKYAGTWTDTSPSGLDSYFKLYLGGVTSTIGGDSYVGGVTIGTGSVGDAWAHDVEGASVAGHLYCQVGSHNNKSCDTSRSDPSAQSYPVSDANINDWKTEASSGGVISGNYSVGSSGATLGPKKITGNLTVSGGGTLTLSGTVWVQGNISVSGGGKIKLSSLYGSQSGVILSDGYISLAGGGALDGSGFSGSYLLILTTSKCPDDSYCSGNNAMDVSGGAGAVVMSAQNGTMSLSGGMNAKAATAYKITATGGSTINYESGLADMNFQSGPSGGWNISTWQETQ